MYEQNKRNMKLDEKLSRFITNDLMVDYMLKVEKTLENDELFRNGLNYDQIAGLSLDELRQLAVRRARRIFESRIFPSIHGPN